MERVPRQKYTKEFREQAVRLVLEHLAEARMECDILKKATAYFAKAQLPGTRS